MTAEPDNGNVVKLHSMRTVHKTCNLCEAMCGLRIEVEGREVRRIEADPDDPLSQGAICPKAIALKQIQEDPDRLRQPVRKTARGFEPISWTEAFEETAERVASIQLRDGNDAVASYLGNPGAHSFGIIVYQSLCSSPSAAASTKSS